MAFYIYHTEQFFQNIIRDSSANIQASLEEKEGSYEKFSISKNSGTRTIYSIKSESKLKKYQKNLLSNFFEYINISDQSYGFVKERSYKDYLQPHINNNLYKDRYYLRLDIKEFFESIKRETIKKELSFYFRLKDSKQTEEILKLVTDIVTLNDSIPQGAVTSPTLSNIIFRELDVKINAYCNQLGVVYTRYADDMLFSSFREHDKFAQPLIKVIYKILKTKGFKLNYKKTIKGKNQISLNGFIVGDNIRLSRKRKKDINNIIFHYYKSGKNIEQFLNSLSEVDLIYRHKNINSLGSLVNYLNGYRAFLIDWIPVNVSNDKISKHSKNIDTIEQIVERLENFKNSIRKLK
ncbi:reverse transcriptase family protein [Bacillus mojavensis]|uniref:reverse transcriptase family protein n=1 Tax=Bacillus mojavensis TaxID=72360 RepID=UPI00256EE698|nr:reverse transcriptase family protein [Bacillus mojavensis]